MRCLCDTQKRSSLGSPPRRSPPPCAPLRTRGSERRMGRWPRRRRRCARRTAPLRSALRASCAGASCRAATARPQSARRPRRRARGLASCVRALLLLRIAIVSCRRAVGVVRAWPVFRFDSSCPSIGARFASYVVQWTLAKRRGKAAAALLDEFAKSGLDALLSPPGEVTSPLTPHPSHLAPHPSPLAPHPSPLTPPPSHLAPHPSHLAPHPSHLTPRPSPLSPHPSPLTLGSRTRAARRAVRVGRGGAQASRGAAGGGGAGELGQQQE